MGTSVGQNQQFKDRLNRIKPGAPNTFGQIYVGTPEDGSAEEQLRPHFGVFATLFCLMLGAASYLLAHLVKFHVMAGGLVTEDMVGAQAWRVVSVAGDMILALLLVFVLLKIFRKRGFGPVMAGIVGLFVMMGGHASLIETAPAFFAALYDPQIASRLIAS